MNRDEREQALWHDAYMLAMSQDPHPAESSGWADAAVAEFRKRYPPQSQAPEAVWYDEPPFTKDDGIYYCWVEGSTVPQSICWSGSSGAWIFFSYKTPMYPLNGRRVSPITKPQEPTQ